MLITFIIIFLCSDKYSSHKISYLIEDITCYLSLHPKFCSALLEIHDIEKWEEITDERFNLMYISLSDHYKNEKFVFDNIDKIDKKFIDPLMYTIIKEPIILPGSKVLMDKEHILRHLKTSNNFDPFTRTELTEEMIEKYNSQPEIQEKLALFKRDWEEYLNEFKKNISK